MKNKLLVGLFVLIIIVIGLFVVFQNKTKNISEKFNCEQLNEKECLDNQNVCSLCSEEIISSYISCHSISFCENALNSQLNEISKVNQSISLRDRAIEEYLLAQENFSWQTEKNSRNVCVFKNLGNEGALFPLSLWVYCQEYKIEDGEIIELSGFSGPVLIDYPNELSYYSIDKFSHQSPRDGSLYSKDIKDIFSKETQGKILNFKGIDKLKEVLKEQIVN